MATPPPERGGPPPAIGADLLRAAAAAVAAEAEHAESTGPQAKPALPTSSAISPPAPPTWAPPPPLPAGGRRLVRPYEVTGGRTAADDTRAPLPLESMCFVTPAGRRADLHFERATIALLCGEVQSIAELAAHSRLPLGVARVIVADMRDEGLLAVTLPVRDARPNVALLEKVLDGLRAL